MGQREILEYLQKNPKVWFNAKEITKGTKGHFSMVTRALKVLREFGSIRWSNTRPYTYKHKRLRGFRAY